MLRALKFTYILLILCAFFSCKNNRAEEQKISIFGKFHESDVVVIQLYSGYFEQGRYHTEVNTSPNSICFSIPSKEWLNLSWFQVHIQQICNQAIFINEIEIKNIVTAKYHNFRKVMAPIGNTVVNDTIIDGEVYCSLQKPNIDKPQLSFQIPSNLYSFRPIGIQLILRLSFIATILILTCIFTKQASTQRIIIFSVAISISLLPLYKDFSMVHMIMTMLIAFIYNKSRSFTWQPIFYVLCAIYLMNVIGLSYTGDFKLGLKRLDTSIVLILFSVVFSMIHFSKKNVILLLRFFVWLVITFCAFGFLSYVTIVLELTWNMVFSDSKLYAPLLMMWPAHPHPSYLSVILLMAVPVALYLRYHDEKRITMVEMLLGILLPIVFTTLSGARVGMMIVPVLLTLGYLFYCKFKPALKWGLAFAGVVAVGVMFYLFPNTDNRFIDHIRIDLRKTAISAIKEKPVFGWGTGYVEPLIQSEERAKDLGIENTYPFNQFHNQYLEDMVQFGILGILILLVLFGWLLWIGVREKNYLILSFLVIYTLFCWTETVFFVAKGVIPFTFWLCFLISNRTALMCPKSAFFIIKNIKKV